ARAGRVRRRLRREPSGRIQRHGGQPRQEPARRDLAHPAPEVVSVTEPEALVAALREDGAEAFDPPAFGLVLALLARADAAGGGARARLRERARERSLLLQGALHEAREAAGRELSALVEAGASVAPAIAEALARGEIAVARREIRRARHDLTRRRR